MTNSKDAFIWIKDQISLDESPDEIRTIVFMLMEAEFNVTKSQILASSQIERLDREKIQIKINRINSGEPIQYITGRQDFYGRIFKVNRSVLIPRPETEQLVSTVIEYAKTFGDANLSLLDIGTGSGCIPITMTLELKNIKAEGIDISVEALAVANENSTLHSTSISFYQCDVLSEIPKGKYDIITSNPPYITESEKAEMKTNVLDFEPHEALFVSDDDPLHFHRCIIEKSTLILNEGGLLVVEINEKYGNEVKELFLQHDFQNPKIIKDLSKKDRIIKGIFK